MDGSTGPPSDVKAMGSENDEGSKVRGGNTDDSAATSIPSPTSSTTSSSSSLTSSYPMIQTDSEYHAGGSIRADSLFPIPTTSSSPPGRGCVAATVIESDEITMTITPTTGGQFDLTVDRMDTVENLKKIISKRLKVAKERICLLHRERQLREGTLEENGLQDGNRLTLLPSVETGLLAQRPEQSVMQALESLNDSQVNDFLSGKAPLNLTMRLGDHMMLIQLQLSTVTPASASTNQTSNSTSGLTIGGSSTTGTNVPTSNVSSSLQSRRSTVLAARSTTSISTKLQNSNAAPRTTSLIDSLASALHADPHCLPRSSFCNCQTQSTCGTNHSESVSPVNSFNACPFCLLHRHHRRPHRHHRHHRHHHHHYHHHSRNKPPLPTSMSQFFSSSINKLLQSTSTTGHGCTDSSMPYNIILPRKKLCTAHHHPQPSTSGTDSSRSSTTTQDGDSSPQSPTSPLADQTMKTATLDTRALAEASRNLTQKLKQLSSEENARRRQGAIIESMHHHGKGVYSGTFSGTLNPALQDRLGRPKRDISTIIHILNDLLCATPAATAGHYRHHHRHSNGRQQSSPSTSTTGTTTSANGTTTPIGCQDTSAPGYSSEELSKENEATKGKMRHLRLVMEQRRAKRRARRLARAAPFTTQWAAVTPDPNTSASSSSATGTNAAEPQNEPELQPCSPEPVVA